MREGDGIRVAILGASGRMGRQVHELLDADERFECVARVARGSGSRPVGAGCFDDAQVVIDFSLPEALHGALPFVGSCALVSGTTGLDPETWSALDAQASVAPVLHAANFSLGIELLKELVERAAAAFPHADLEIVEAHHRRKVDSPSGTALLLGEAAARGRGTSVADLATHGRQGAAGPRPDGEIGFHAIRGGDVVGEHVVHLLAAGERLALTHRATSRATFAHGAVAAAAWIVGRPAGRYTLSDVLRP